MIKSQVLLTASISVIFGIMIGVLGEAWVWMQTTSEFTRLGSVAKSEANIETKVELLEHLRSGRYNDAAKLLEELLDKDLTRAAESARVGIIFSSDTLKALDTERRARKISGYEPVNSTVGVAIQDVFRLVPQSGIAWHGTPIIPQDNNHATSIIRIEQEN
jgi:hypothetical protein